MLQSDKSKGEKEKTRRNFLKLGLGASAAAIVGCGLTQSCTSSVIQEEGKEEMAKLLSPDGQLIEVPKSQLKPVMCSPVSTEEARKGMPGKKFVMVIDLAKCKNARKCVSACQKMHYLNEDQEWLSVKLMKDNENTSPYWFPKTCFHCDNPPCVKVCPVSATFKRDDGLVLIDNERCIGCKFCMVACPYSTRVFNWEDPQQPPEAFANPFSPESSVPAQKGTVGKCDFCPDMTRMGKLPDCVTACPNGVFYFGDENEDTVTNGEETVRFSQLLKDKAGYRYMEELGTKPRVYYLPPTDRLAPFEKGLENLSEEEKARYKDVLEG